MDLQALWLTIRLATLVALALLGLGLPVAYWITYSRWRWKFLVEAVVALPLVLPPTVLGFYVLIALGPRSPVGRWWQVFTGHTLVFTFEGLLLGSILYSLPFAVQPFAAAFAGVDSRLLAASATLGASRWRTFLRVILSKRDGARDRCGSELRAHAGRIRPRPDGGREHSRRDTNGFHRYLRQSAGRGLCGRE